ncbi:MAG: transposase [Patescibacteria group bacterium]
MVDKFLGKYRIKSTRLRNWDYSADGYYFITICTKNRENFLGEICNKKMFLSPIGKIVQKYWQEIPQHFPNTKLDEFVVMPNHVHGILIIDNWNDKTVETPQWGVSTKGVSTKGVSTNMVKTCNPHHNPEWKSGTIGVIINQFKSICTKHAREIRQDFAWQARYHDHIICDDKEHNNIQVYILSNPANWEKDVENLRN